MDQHDVLDNMKRHLKDLKKKAHAARLRSYAPMSLINEIKIFEKEIEEFESTLGERKEVVNKVTMISKFEVVEDTVLENTSEHQRLVKETIVSALSILVDGYDGVDGYEERVAVAKKLLHDVNS